MEHKPTPELIAEVKSAATTAKQARVDNIASITQEYGEGTGKFVEHVSEALLLSKGIIQVGLSKGKEDSVVDVLGQHLAVDMISKLVAITCEVSEKAYGLTHDQAMEALAMAQEIADKVVGSIDPILEREKAKDLH